VNLDKTKDPNQYFSMNLVEEMIYAAGKQITQAQLKTIMANMRESTFTEAKFREILSSLGFIAAKLTQYFKTPTKKYIQIVMCFN